jgi:hypothetical protein
MAKSMHQTTVRFSDELWADLAAEADVLGVSVAQFIREAALARLAYSAARRGDRGWEAALRLAGAEPGPISPGQRYREGARTLRETGSALSAQGRQARARARALALRRLQESEVEGGDIASDTAEE